LLPALLVVTASGGQRRMSISGQSAGGSMAIQHLFAYSSLVDGAGIAAGSPYGCGALPDRGQHCWYGHGDIQSSIAYVRQRFAQGLIDDPADLRNTPVVLFNGRNDWTVYTQVMRDALKQLEAFVEPWQLTTRFSTDATHVWSIDHGSCSCGSCDWTSGPLVCCDVNNCGYDLSGDMLTHIYGPVAPRTPAVQTLQLVDQWSFMPGRGVWQSSGLERWGLVYVPTGCKGVVQRCRVHVNYHGCIERKWERRVLWVTSLDLNEYGEANDIIVVYPQAAGDGRTGVGCWNWGFRKDDPLFDARDSVQLKMVVQLVQGLEAALAQSISLDVGGPLPAWLLESTSNQTAGDSSAPASGSKSAFGVPTSLPGPNGSMLETLGLTDLIL